VRPASPAPDQARVLGVVARRLERGDEPLPTDVFASVVCELERRADLEAIRWAWEDQADAAPEPYFGGALRLLRGAARTLAALEGPAKDEVETALGSIAAERVPRGAAPLHDASLPGGGPGGHLRFRAGRVRVLYKMESGRALVVALTPEV